MVITAWVGMGIVKVLTVLLLLSVFHNLAPRPIIYRVSVHIPTREAAVAIAMKIVSCVMATLVRYYLQKCSLVSTLTFVSQISKLLLWHEVDLRTVRPTS